MEKKNFILETTGGDTFQEVATKASIMATMMGDTLVEFDFNGVKCLVTIETNVDWLFRDYCNSWTMEWKEVGPDCVENYPAEVQKELDERTTTKEAKRKEQQAIWDEEERKQKEALSAKLNGTLLLIRPDKKDEYAEYVRINSDGGYSQAVIEYSEAWARLMQIETAKGREVKDVAEETQTELGFFGITGFQYGCAVRGLSQFWVFGEELRKWHNKEYGHEGKGVVNPAMLSVSIKD